jgi:Fe-S cluster biosynthesis and repair protein YggX
MMSKRSNFNKFNRIKVCKRLIKKYEKLDRELYPYDYGDTTRYYVLQEYWNKVLLKLKKKNND